MAAHNASSSPHPQPPTPPTPALQSHGTHRCCCAPCMSTTACGTCGTETWRPPSWVSWREQADSWALACAGVTNDAVKQQLQPATPATCYARPLGVARQRSLQHTSSWQLKSLRIASFLHALLPALRREVGWLLGCLLPADCLAGQQRHPWHCGRHLHEGAGACFLKKGGVATKPACGSCMGPALRLRGNTQIGQAPPFWFTRPAYSPLCKAPHPPPPHTHPHTPRPPTPRAPIPT